MLRNADLKELNHLVRPVLANNFDAVEAAVRFINVDDFGVDNHVVDAGYKHIQPVIFRVVGEPLKR